MADGVYEPKFPTHIMITLIITSLVMGASISLLVLHFLGIETIDPYIIICALMTALTLFATALASVKDWYEKMEGTIWS